MTAIADGSRETGHTAARTLFGAPSAVYAYAAVEPVSVETVATANAEPVEIEIVDVEADAVVADVEAGSAAAVVEEPAARSAEGSTWSCFAVVVGDPLSLG